MMPTKLIALLVSLFASLTAVRAQTVLHMATPYGDSCFCTVIAQHFASEVKDATKGEVIIRIGTLGTLAPLPQIKNAVRSGQVAMGDVPAAALSNENPLFSLNFVPYVATDAKQASLLYKITAERMREYLAKQGIRLLYVTIWPGHGLFTKKPLRDVKDLRGTQFRTQLYEVQKFAQVVGAVPIQVAQSDVPQAFATGRVDVMLTTTPTGVDTAAWDFSRYYYNTNMTWPLSIAIMNDKEYSQLTPAQQAAIDRAAKLAEAEGATAAIEEDRVKARILAEHGMNVLTPSQELDRELRVAGAEVLRDWEQRAGGQGADLVAAYKKALKGSAQ